jgi:hypothetical protein
MSTTSSSFYDLIAQLLVDEMLSQPVNMYANTHSSQPNTRVNRNADYISNTIQPINSGTSMNNALVEIMRAYNTTINQYNTNISQYNQNIERIIHLIRPTDSSHRSNIHYSSSTNSIRQTEPSSDVSYNPYSVLYRNSNRDASSNYMRINTPIEVPETPRVLFRHFQFPETSNIHFQFPDTSNIMNRTGNTYLGRINEMLRNINVHDNRTGGLTEAQIEMATEEIIFDFEHFSENNLSTQCPISLDEFTRGEHLLQLRNCKHVFRSAELRRWFSQHSRCPVCRADAIVQNGPVGVSGNLVSRRLGPTGPISGMYSIGPTGQRQEDPSEYTNATYEDEDYSDMPDLIENFADNAYHFEYSYYFEFPQNQ